MKLRKLCSPEGTVNFIYHSDEGDPQYGVLEAGPVDIRFNRRGRLYILSEEERAYVVKEVHRRLGAYAYTLATAQTEEELLISLRHILREAGQCFDFEFTEEAAYVFSTD